MDFNQFIENFQTAADFITPIEIGLDTQFSELEEWDSVAALGVIVMSDIEYGVTITGDDLKTCATIGDLAKLVASRIK